MVEDKAVGRNPQRQHKLRTSEGSVLLDSKPKPTIALEYPDSLPWGRCDVTLESWSVDKPGLGQKLCAQQSAPSCSHPLVVGPY